MGRRSCFHCGIKQTALWRTGPSEKPNLCNACGTRWRLKGTLANYIPKHGFVHTEFLAADANYNGFPLNLKVPRKKRSVLPQYCLTRTGRLHRQLLQVLHEQNSSAKTSSEEGNDLLIDNSKWMMSSNETALGATLLN